MRRVHRIICFISWGALLAAFIHLCLKWSSMPEVTGVHFDGDGNFDVFASKKFIAYPFTTVGIKKFSDKHCKTDTASYGFCEVRKFSTNLQI